LGGTITSCGDLYDNQPVASPGGYDQAALQDTTFVISAKSGVSPLAIQVADLDGDLTLLTCTSLPAVLDTTTNFEFALQLSKESDFSTYVDVNSQFNGEVGGDVSVNGQVLNDTLLSFNNAVEEQTVYARLLVFIVKNGLKTVKASDIVSLQITPYKNPLMPYYEVTPKPYYIIGLADGNWNNSVAGLGVSIYPMSVVSGNAYDVNGNGTFTYTGYFSASRSFKLIRDIGSWDEQWGMTGTAYKHNDSGAGNISVPADGYYTITLNSIDNTLTVEASSVAPTSYNQIGFIGGFNGWGSDVVMSGSESTNNHMWYTTLPFADAGQGKFRADGGWTISWGTPSQTGDGDPAYMLTGLGVQDGKNIGYEAGTYTLLFNDIDGCYWFVKN